MRLTWEHTRLELREPLRISRAVTSARGAVTVTLTADPAEPDAPCGHGEVVASAYQRLDTARIVRLLRQVARWVAAHRHPAELLAALPELTVGPGALLRDAPGVTAALDAAAHDMLGHLTGSPVHALLGEREATPVPTAFTIGITAPDVAGTTARNLVARGFTVLKIKAGADTEGEDVARVAAVRRAAPVARLILDPNGAWSPEQAVRVLERMAPYGLDAVEQPVPPNSGDALAWVARRCAAPLVADEDAAGPADIPRLAGAVRGVNIKLAKCGGLRAAVETAELAAAHGLDVMLGCLASSSLGVAPAVHLTARARWVDLDGHLLLARDPWTGIGGEKGVVRASGRPGLGVRRRGGEV